jgi:four helix bundle protein
LILLFLGRAEPSSAKFLASDRVAQADHLPIYKRAYDLCLYIEQIVRNFSRYHKYSLGQDLRDGARQVLKLVVRANARRDKVPVLLALREEVEELKVVLRLCHDVKAFPNFNSFEHAITQVTDIAKQNEGWLTSQRQGLAPTGPGQNRPVISARVAAPSVP